MFGDCTTNDYDELYSRYLDNPDKLLDLAEYDPGNDILLDLCGGTGAITKAAIKRGAKEGSIYLIDINPRCPEEYMGFKIEIRKGDSYLRIWKYPLDIIRLNTKPIEFSKIICRQAINYTYLEATTKRVYSNLKDNGLFVFNTFVKPQRLNYKRYTHKDCKFTEISLRFFKFVYHIQMKRSPYFAIDFTKFKWYTIEEFIDALYEAGFEYVKIKKEKNSLYFIVKKENEKCQSGT